ncbi:MAG: AAA family ATPase [Candidatus Thalassarchaeaceae archaeon]|jgi:cytidylate kinase|nr:AAA family ATPase [Candidatus Thalassarchaeaceae archaeon]
MDACAVKFALRSGGDELVHLTVSGHPGSGTTTLVSNLCRRNGWTSVNGGEIFREEAARRGMNLEEFSILCVNDEEVDRNLDLELKRRMSLDNGPDIVESRLAGWWAYRLNIDCIRVWLSVSENERALRVVNREGGSVDYQQEKIVQRMEADASRYAKLYDINIESMEPYNCIIEGDEIGAEKVLEQVLAHMG